MTSRAPRLAPVEGDYGRLQPFRPQLGSAHETPAQHASYFATAATDQRLSDAKAECHLRVEGAQRRVRRVAVRRVVEICPI